MQSREDWLKQRKELLTASDVAAIIGESPYRTNIDVYRDKIEKKVSSFDMDHLKFGRDVEGAIANLFETRTGRSVTDLGETHISVHPDIPWLGATLDRMNDVEGIQRPLELKHVGTYQKKDDWTDDPPAHYQIQGQIQAACTLSDSFTLAGMFPGYDLGWVDMDSSKEFMDVIFPIIDEFWNHNVKKNICPDLVEHDKGLDSAKALYYEENGETVVLSGEALLLANRIDGLKEDIKGATTEKKNMEATLRMMMGNATFGALGDGSYLTLKTQKRKEYTAKATEFRVMRRTKKL